MTNQTPFAAGMRVVVFDRHRGDRTSEVARVLKRFVELKDGSHWDLGGWPYPRDTSYLKPHIQPLCDAPAGTLDRIRKERLVDRLGRHKWQDESLETLRAVAKALEPAIEDAAATEPTP